MVKTIYKASKQRTAVLTLLRSTKTHPTAAWLYERLKPDIPGLSLGTVYRNLTILSDQGLIQALHSGSGFDRFDADVSSHYHVTCEQCGKVEDLSLPPESLHEEEAARISGYAITSHRLDYFGICPECQQHREHTDPEAGKVK